ncbi:MAG: hypothetical protein WC254_03670 [Candidatus Woesearchaeota archaeon]|jgi:hypothetical protein
MGLDVLDQTVLEWLHKTGKFEKSNASYLTQLRLVEGMNPVIFFYYSNKQLPPETALTEDEALATGLGSLNLFSDLRSHYLQKLQQNLERRDLVAVQAQLSSISSTRLLLSFLKYQVEQAKDTADISVDKRITGPTLESLFRRNVMELDTFFSTPDPTKPHPSAALYLQVPTPDHPKGCPQLINGSIPIYALLLTERGEEGNSELYKFHNLSDLKVADLQQSPRSISIKQGLLSAYRPTLEHTLHDQRIRCVKAFSIRGIVEIGIAAVSTDDNTILQYHPLPNLGRSPKIKVPLTELTKRLETATEYVPVVYAFDTLGRGCALSLR